MEANERFKNTVTRYSGRVGSALAGAFSIRGRGFIGEVSPVCSRLCEHLICDPLVTVLLQVFGLSVDSPETSHRQHGGITTVESDCGNGRTSVSYDTRDKVATEVRAGSKDANVSISDHLSSASMDSTEVHGLGVLRFIIKIGIMQCTTSFFRKS